MFDTPTGKKSREHEMHDTKVKRQRQNTDRPTAGREKNEEKIMNGKYLWIRSNTALVFFFFARAPSFSVFFWLTFACFFALIINKIEWSQIFTQITQAYCRSAQSICIRFDRDEHPLTPRASARASQGKTERTRRGRGRREEGNCG